jgi:hypothetical protein
MTPPRERLSYSSPFTRPPLKPPGKARMIVATSTRAAHSPRNALLRARSHRKNYAARQ